MGGCHGNPKIEPEPIFIPLPEPTLIFSPRVSALSLPADDFSPTSINTDISYLGIVSPRAETTTEGTRFSIVTIVNSENEHTLTQTPSPQTDDL